MNDLSQTIKAISGVNVAKLNTVINIVEGTSKVFFYRQGKFCSP